MHIKIPNPSRKSLIAFVVLSLTLHLFVCKLPVQSMKLHDDDVKVFQVSLISVAAPSMLGNADINELKNINKNDLAIIEPAAGKVTSMPKPAEQNKTKSFISSNDKGKDSVTIDKNLDDSDYIQTVAPIYPLKAIERGFEGVVIVKALINSNGTAENVDIASSSGHQMLDVSAIKAVSQWKFKQSALNKATAEMWVQVPVKFVIR